MPLKFPIIWLPLLLFSCHLMAEIPQCFRFTWIGAYENHSNIQSETCDTRVGDFNEIPCSMPLVVTPDDTVPDVKALWQNQTEDREKFLCQMSAGFSCVKFSYIFKGGSKLSPLPTICHRPHNIPLTIAVQNITYMAAKVNNTNGCFIQTYENGMQVEACVCTSRVGLIPCNGSANNGPTLVMGWALCLLGSYQLLNKYRIV
ncbi:hypothetical protein KR026_006748 [Drosophila bipectinata]|nr:hypothetical protein KR026_006748 [Drosophila bipectinata]